MTVKDIAARKGISPQAIYKRIKTAGIDLDALKDKETGAITPEGERVLAQLFELSDDELEQEQTDLTTQVERLQTDLSALRRTVEDLTAERDYLREALAQAQRSLELSQQLQAMTASKIPMPAPILLEDPEHRKKKKHKKHRKDKKE